MRDPEDAKRELEKRQEVALKKLAEILAIVEKDSGAVKSSAAALNKDLAAEKDE